jgi:hypothetical protein
VVAGRGDEQYGNDEDGSEEHAGFCGQMKQRSTR